MTKKKTYSTIVGVCWREKVVSVFGFGHSKYHFRAPENGHFWKRPINVFFCIFGRHSYRYNIYQVRMEFRKLFYILVHPNAHACFPNTKINTTRKYTNTKYIGLEIIPKCYQILGPIGKNIMHILTGCPWNHFGCQSLKERFFRDTLYSLFFTFVIEDSCESREQKCTKANQSG